MFDIAVFALGTLAALLLLAYFQAPILVWTVAAGIMLAPWLSVFGLSMTALYSVAAVFLVIAAVLNIVPLRRRLISDHVLAMFRRILPDMSQT